MEQRPGGEDLQVGDGRSELQIEEIKVMFSEQPTRDITNRIPTMTYPN